ncbi:MAG: aspartate aminotransferase family protein [Candidatus Nanopelagicales bacterium]
MAQINDPELAQHVLDLDRAHVFHSWSAQGSLNPVTIAGGLGSRVWDFNGKSYLDFSSQLVFTNLGHQHPKLIAAIKEQADVLCTAAPPYAVQARGEAAQAISALMPDSHQKVFFTNGGADGNENAIRMARLFTGKRKILSTHRSYHGNTGAAIMATGDQRRWPNEYADGHAHFFGPFLYRTPFWATTEEEECARALDHLEQTILFEGPSTIAAVILEAVPGSAGVLVPPAGYLEGVRALCDKYAIMYIADEVMCGFGRTGSWFGFDHAGVVPDLVVFAKGVNSGYVPLGGVIISNEIAHHFDDRVFPGGLTYSGHPLACASAVASIDILRDEAVIENADTVGNGVLGPKLRDLIDKHPSIGEVRGQGMFWAIELVADRHTREPLAPYGGTSPAMAAVGAAARANGLVSFIVGNRIHVVPPLVLTAEEAIEGVEILDLAIAEADKHVSA